MHATLCDILADLVQNAVEAGASQVDVEVASLPGLVSVCVRDNGKGMDAETLRKAVSPFYSEAGKHDHRKVGLGLPLLIQTAEAAGGKADITSEPGKGTEVRFTMDAGSWDIPPMGDLPETVVGLMTLGGGGYDLRLSRRTARGEYEVSRRELVEALGNLEEAGTLVLAKAFLESQEAEIGQAGAAGVPGGFNGSSGKEAEDG